MHQWQEWNSTHDETEIKFNNPLSDNKDINQNTKQLKGGHSQQNHKITANRNYNQKNKAIAAEDGQEIRKI